MHETMSVLVYSVICVYDSFAVKMQGSNQLFPCWRKKEIGLFCSSGFQQKSKEVECMLSCAPLRSSGQVSSTFSGETSLINTKPVL